jgi:hypothetical protein
MISSIPEPDKLSVKYATERALPYAPEAESGGGTGEEDQGPE